MKLFILDSKWQGIFGLALFFVLEGHLKGTIETGNMEVVFQESAELAKKLDDCKDVVLVASDVEGLNILPSLKEKNEKIKVIAWKFALPEVRQQLYKKKSPQSQTIIWLLEQAISQVSDPYLIGFKNPWANLAQDIINEKQPEKVLPFIKSIINDVTYEEAREELHGGGSGLSSA